MLSRPHPLDSRPARLWGKQATSTSILLSTSSCQCFHSDFGSWRVHNGIYMLCRDWSFLSDECVVHAILRIFLRKCSMCGTSQFWLVSTHFLHNIYTAQFHSYTIHHVYIYLLLYIIWFWARYWSYERCVPWLWVSLWGAARDIVWRNCAYLLCFDISTSSAAAATSSQQNKWILDGPNA